MRKNKVGILLGSLAVLIIIFLIAQPKINDYQKEVEKANFYQSGIELMKQGRWSEAKAIFLDADKRPDSDSPYVCCIMK